MKKLLCYAAIAAMVLIGCSKELKVVPANKLVIEYGDKLDNSKLFNKKDSDKGIKVKSVKGFDAKKIGEQTLKVTFTDGDKKAEKDIKVTIKDTKKPIISLKKDKIKITAGDKLVLKDNVKSVEDPVDGKLKYSDKELKKSGYYIDKGKLNTKKAGTYNVAVKAYDANGNEASKAFTVTVKKKPAVKKETAATNNGAGNTAVNNGSQAATPVPNTNSSNGNGGSQGNSNPSSNNTGGQSSSQTKPQEKPTACVSDGNFGAIGNSGKVFMSYDEMTAWANSVIYDKNSPYYMMGYNAWTVYDNCGERNDVWTIDFY